MKFLRVLQARFSPKLENGYQDHIHFWANDLKKSISTNEILDLKEKYKDVPTKKSPQNQKPKKKK